MCLLHGSTWGQGDFDGDEDVDLDDFGILKTHFGTDKTTVPEPAVLYLLALGTLGVLRRRSRTQGRVITIGLDITAKQYISITGM